MNVKKYNELTKEELLELQKELNLEYKNAVAKGLNLDMSRGKPCKEQLDLSMQMIGTLAGTELTCEQGVDCRNYGVLDGIVEAKRLLSAMIECPIENIIIYGNSSLNVMYDTVARSMTHGVMGSTPWSQLDGPVKFLCPVPGYDRHFAICEFFGIEMIPVPMLSTGPDMDIVEKLVGEDEMIKGIWCVPKYSNPQGITYSDDTVRRFARLKPKAKDFRIYWDNAYGIHHLYDNDQDYLIELLHEAYSVGNEDIVFKFCSTSKVTFPGSGVAAISASEANLEFVKQQLSVQTIGYDKVNQLRHSRFFKDFDGMVQHMRRHADILRPKFEAVLEMLEEGIGGLGIGEWTKPKGGYFISFDTLDGCAKRVVQLCKEAGVIMTPAGATFPYGKDPRDSNIRIAPTFPSITDLIEATKIFILCVKKASVEKLLEE